MRTSGHFSLAVGFLTGLTAVVAQIVLLRELIVVFYGNEVSLGLMLATWLLWTALGSTAFGRFASRSRRPRRLVAGLEALLAVALPAAIFAVRAGRLMFPSLPGELLGPGPMLLASFATLGLFCVTSGALFAATSRLYAAEAGLPAAGATGLMYLLEAAGSAFGGVIASLVLIRYLTTFQIAWVVALLNLAVAARLVLRRRHAIPAALLGAIAVVYGPWAALRLESISLAALWRGFHVVAARNSMFGNLVVTETEGMRTIYENGLALSTLPDAAAAEEAVHFALLQHPAPRTLLLIGGGASGSVEQALQHRSLERIDYVELDPTVLELAPLAENRRVHVHNTDGRRFLKAARSSYDVIIVNLPEPRTAQLNRFYTLEFFQEAARSLAPGGVFSFQLSAPENYISPPQAEFLRCIHKTLCGAFPEVSTMPADPVHWFATNQAGVLARDAKAILERLRARKLHTLYVREYFIPFRMTPDRVAELEAQIRPRADTPVNRDFAPIAYYFDTALWSSQYARGTEQWFRTIARVRFGRVAAGVALLLAVLAALLRRRGRPAGAAFCVAAMGFTLIGLELLVLLAFQAIYGYVYHQLALLIAGFMAGMALGSWRALRAAAGIRALVLTQCAATALPLLLYWLFEVLAGIRDDFLTPQVLFPALAVLCGALGGYQFPAASRVYFAEHKSAGPGLLYGLDLAGACLGALALSAYVIPVFGFLRTAALMALVNAAPAVLLAWPLRGRRTPAP